MRRNKVGDAHFHECNNLLEDFDGSLLIGSDEPVGDTRPSDELDAFAIELSQLNRRIKCCRRHNGGDGDRLTRARVTADQGVVFGQVERDRNSVLANSDDLRLPKRR